MLQGISRIALLRARWCSRLTRKDCASGMATADLGSRKRVIPDSLMKIGCVKRTFLVRRCSPRTGNPSFKFACLTGRPEPGRRARIEFFTSLALRRKCHNAIRLGPEAFSRHIRGARRADRSGRRICRNAAVVFHSIAIAQRFAGAPARAFAQLAIVAPAHQAVAYVARMQIQGRADALEGKRPGTFLAPDPTLGLAKDLAPSPALGVEVFLVTLDGIG